MQISEEKIKRFLNILMFQIHFTAVCTFCHWLFSWQTWWNASKNDCIEGIYKEFEPSHDKTNKMTVRPAKTQISLGIRPVWSESSLCAQWVLKDPNFLHADSEDWSDRADAQADLSLRWAHMPFCWFCREAAQFYRRSGDFIRLL